MGVKCQQFKDSTNFTKKIARKLPIFLTFFCFGRNHHPTSNNSCMRGRNREKIIIVGIAVHLCSCQLMACNTDACANLKRSYLNEISCILCRKSW